MDNRREFLKKAALLTGSAAIAEFFPQSIQRALAINAAPGTTYRDAKHVVFLMQENRSFDHIFGTLKGVRGYSNPHKHIKPDGNNVLLQKNKKGESFAPFHFDLDKTKVTWQGGLPHGWPDQSRARNKGKYDEWIEQKGAFCMGYYNRADMPFYHALADAFTVFDHAHCSTLTGTTPNRLVFWSGTVNPPGNKAPVVNNSQAESHTDTYVDWLTFPEVLQQHGVDWRVYQNEIWTTKQATEDINDWLDNYGDNPLEYVKKYNVKLNAYYREHGDPTAKPPLTAQQVTDKYNALTDKERDLIDRAFATNINQGFDHLAMEPFNYTDDEGKEQTIEIPKNDILYRFRKDVESGNLPAVSWLVAPQRFSDHTSSPHYGTWYVSETLNILTKNPEVWRNTIFILNYDENDGFFDHLPPFVPPVDSEDGGVSGISDTGQEVYTKQGWPIGSGYRIPFVIASPWTKGGYVNSQLTDHTSCLQFLEHWLSHKLQKEVKTPMISNWRRALFGNLTTAFRPYNGQIFPMPPFERKANTITRIQRAKDKPSVKPLPLAEDEITHFKTANPTTVIPVEKGVRKANPLPYILGCNVLQRGNSIEIGMAVNTMPDHHPVGTGYSVTLFPEYKGQAGVVKHYSLAANTSLKDVYNLADMGGDNYDIYVQGPNGFHRQFSGNAKSTGLTVVVAQSTRRGNAEYLPALGINIKNTGAAPVTVTLTDEVYHKQRLKTMTIGAGSQITQSIDFAKWNGWYNLVITVQDNNALRYVYAGHLEDGGESTSDPHMGGVL